MSAEDVVSNVARLVAETEASIRVGLNAAGYGPRATQIGDAIESLGDIALPPDLRYRVDRLLVAMRTLNEILASLTFNATLPPPPEG